MKNEILSTNSPYSIIQKENEVSIYLGEKITQLYILEELENFKNKVKSKVIFILPFSLAGREKLHSYIGNEPILAMEVIDEVNISKQEILNLLPNQDIQLTDIQPSISDEDFKHFVSKFKNEIHKGNICQGIISREFGVDLPRVDRKYLLSIYRKLLGINGGYMNFVFDTGDKAFMGASPERHLTIEGDKVMKNPIAGTIQKNPETFYEDLINFLQNKKEENELSMVTDEELKMIMKITSGGTIGGPSIREIGKVFHTEFDLLGYKLPGIKTIDCLRQTLYSPTIVGGPLDSAFELIAKYEKQSRKYYGTAFGIFDGENLDTTIPIRSAEIDKKNKKLSVRAGAGIVKDSVPELEMRETTNKALGFLGVLNNSGVISENLFEQLTPEQKATLDKIIQKRRENLSNIYFQDCREKNMEVAQILGKKFVLINNGDDFVYMIAYLIEKMGGECEVIKNRDYKNSDNFDFTILGPGPGNINDKKDKIMVKLLEITKKLEQNNQKTIGICLGHQALCKSKGMDVAHQGEICQGKQAEIEIFGEKQKVAFYNSFSPVFDYTNKPEEFETYNDNRLLYQKTGNSISVQFHPESIMSINGFDILKNMILKLIV